MTEENTVKQEKVESTTETPKHTQKTESAEWGSRDVGFSGGGYKTLDQTFGKVGVEPEPYTWEEKAKRLFRGVKSILQDTDDTSAFVGGFQARSTIGGSWKDTFEPDGWGQPISFGDPKNMGQQSKPDAFSRNLATFATVLLGISLIWYIISSVVTVAMQVFTFIGALACLIGLIKLVDYLSDKDEAEGEGSEKE